MFARSKIYSYLYTSFKINNVYRTDIVTDKGKDRFQRASRLQQGQYVRARMQLGSEIFISCENRPRQFQERCPHYRPAKNRYSTKYYVPISAIMIVELQRLERLSFN